MQWKKLEEDLNYREYFIYAHIFFLNDKSPENSIFKIAPLSFSCIYFTSLMNFSLLNPPTEKTRCGFDKSEPGSTVLPTQEEVCSNVPTEKRQEPESKQDFHIAKRTSHLVA